MKTNLFFLFDREILLKFENWRREYQYIPYHLNSHFNPPSSTLLISAYQV